MSNINSRSRNPEAVADALQEPFNPQTMTAPLRRVKRRLCDVVEMIKAILGDRAGYVEQLPGSSIVIVNQTDGQGPITVIENKKNFGVEGMSDDDFDRLQVLFR